MSTTPRVTNEWGQISKVRLRARCSCGLCARHRRVRYIIHQLERLGDEPAARFIERSYDYMLELEFERDMQARHESTEIADVDTGGRV